MKRYSPIAVLAVLLIAAAPSFAQLDYAKHWPCNPAGAWYEEGGPPYVLNVVPIQGRNRFSLNFEGNYLPESLGAVVMRDFTTMTNWFGEMRKGNHGYDAAVMAVFGTGETFPHYPVETWGVAGVAEFGEDCDTLHFTWFDGVQAWEWGETAPVPFVDPVSYYPLGQANLEETYSRMPLPRN